VFKTVAELNEERKPALVGPKERVSVDNFSCKYGYHIYVPQTCILAPLWAFEKGCG
jgi:hypothetical protein